MPTTTLLWLLPVFPLLAFVLIVLFTNRNKALSHTLAVGAAFLSWLGSMVIFVRALKIGPEALAEHPIHSWVNWLPTGNGFLKIGVMVDPLTAAVLFFVAWTIFMIFLYSVGYHNFGYPEGDHDQKGLPPHGATVVDEHGHKHRVPSIEPMYSRFFAYIGLFAAGMYLLAISDNLLTLFVGWEIMGLCSYLLIGFWFAKPSARAAGIKAFMTTRVGDVFMLLGIAYLYKATGTLSFPDIFRPEMLHQLANLNSGVLGLSAAGLIGVLLFIGTVGKSAQWPLHVWLPDAMEGPTPVSAMIHAATMVSAGVYMVIRMFPLLKAGSMNGAFLSPLAVMGFIGGFTALFAATIAVAQNDIKRVLAYSTISQLGYMVAALGAGSYIAATFHLITHAFFKALLFLGSGSVIHGMEHGVLHTGNHEVDPQDMFNMGGLAKKMPITFWTFVIGGFALSGFPVLTAGFWSKDMILSASFFGGHPVIFWTLAIAAFLTAFYTMRQITLTFLGKPRTPEAEHAHETPWTMTVPLMVLAFFAFTAGWVGIPEHFPLLGGLLPDWFTHWVGAAYETLLQQAGMFKEIAEEGSLVPLYTSLTVSLGGLFFGWLVYKDVTSPDPATDPLKKWLGPVHTLLQNKYYFDELYGLIFIRPAYWLAEVFTFRWVDRGLIDGTLHAIARAVFDLGKALAYGFDLPIISGAGDLIGNIVRTFGRAFRVVQTGRVQDYMVATMTSVVAFGALVYYLLVFAH